MVRCCSQKTNTVKKDCGSTTLEVVSDGLLFQRRRRRLKTPQQQQQGGRRCRRSCHIFLLVCARTTTYARNVCNRTNPMWKYLDDDNYTTCSSSLEYLEYVRTNGLSHYTFTRKPDWKTFLFELTALRRQILATVQVLNVVLDCKKNQYWTPFLFLLQSSDEFESATLQDYLKRKQRQAYKKRFSNFHTCSTIHFQRQRQQRRDVSQ